jgi:hypothetical protein
MSDTTSLITLGLTSDSVDSTDWPMAVIPLAPGASSECLVECFVGDALLVVVQLRDVAYNAIDVTGATMSASVTTLSGTTVASPTFAAVDAVNGILTLTLSSDATATAGTYRVTVRMVLSGGTLTFAPFSLIVSQR